MKKDFKKTNKITKQESWGFIIEVFKTKKLIETKTQPFIKTEKSTLVSNENKYTDRGFTQFPIQKCPLPY